MLNGSLCSYTSCHVGQEKYAEEAFIDIKKLLLALKAWQWYCGYVFKESLCLRNKY